MENAITGLVFGDSLTGGYVPKGDGIIFPKEINYPHILADLLKNKWPNSSIVVDGLVGRMVKGENPYKKGTDGWSQFSEFLRSNLPADFVMIMLGTNDMNKLANKSPRQVAKELGEYVMKAREVAAEDGHNTPRIILIAPPVINDTVIDSEDMFAGAKERMNGLAEKINEEALALDCYFMDANWHLEVSSADGVHLNSSGNFLLADALYQFILAVVEEEVSLVPV